MIVIGKKDIHVYWKLDRTALEDSATRIASAKLVFLKIRIMYKDMKRGQMRNSMCVPLQCGSCEARITNSIEFSVVRNVSSY